MRISMRFIQNENIIMLVKEKPVLWDNSHKDFKKNELKRKVWEEISKNLYDNFEEMDEVGQKDFVDALMTRWRSLKERFFSLRREKDSNESSCAFEKYIHSDALQFLEKAYSDCKNYKMPLEDSACSEELPQNKSRELPALVSPTAVITENASKKIIKTRKRTLSNTTGSKRLKTQESEFSNSLKYFFQSLVPELNKFNSSEFLEFQNGFLQVIERVHERRKHNELNFNFNDSWT